jgi:hypothetical protein
MRTCLRTSANGEKPDFITYSHFQRGKQPLDSLPSLFANMETFIQAKSKSDSKWTLKLQLTVVPIRRREGKKTIEQGLDDITDACAREGELLEVSKEISSWLLEVSKEISSWKHSWMVRSVTSFQGMMYLQYSQVPGEGTSVSDSNVQKIKCIRCT